jgi:uncharacterized membrane protein YoaT (DUF817 family)
VDANAWLLLAIFVVGLVALIGFFVTKTKGFGRYATSAFLLLLVVVLSALLFAAGKLEGQILTNILFAIIGFAGGLFTAKEPTAPDSSAKATSSGRSAP